MSSLNTMFSNLKPDIGPWVDVVTNVVDCCMTGLDNANVDRKNALQAWQREKIECILAQAKPAFKADGASLVQVVELYPEDAILTSYVLQMISQR